MPTRRDFIKNSAIAAGSVIFLDAVTNNLFANENMQFIGNTSLRFRQIHLDFHTSDLVKGIAKDFDADKFAARLVKANVNSVNIFAKCCHGNFYYDTKLYPELKHPHLANRNLLKEQIEACHKVGIRTPIYTVIQWDTKQTHKNADWLVLDIKGNPTGTPQNEAGFMRNLCINSPYGDFTKSYIKEVHESMPVDGWWIDIMFEKPCWCPYCTAGMKAEGLNPLSEADGVTYGKKVFKKWKQQVTALINSYDKNASVIYNTGHIGPYIRNSIDSYTHLELESLPSGEGWGYMHFPITSRYARNFGKDFLGMTGKFHTAWGDFNSLKNKVALEAEIFTMLALNAKCSIGDQLHPYGVLDEATYDLIGDVYKQVADKEQWCVDAQPVCDIGVLNAEDYVKLEGTDRVPAQNIGVARILQEGKHQFDFLDAEMPFDKYKLLILPDVISVNDVLQKKLRNFIAGGGKILASYKSLLTEDQKKFTLNIGADYIGDAPYDTDFIEPVTGFDTGLPKTPLVMYKRGIEVKATTGQILANNYAPFFNRTPEHFFSHLHAPSSGKVVYPGIIRQEGTIYFSHPIFSQYAKNAPLWCKKMVLSAIKLLLPTPVIAMDNAPSALVVTINKQSAKNRYVVHNLFYVPERKGFDFDIIEDVVNIGGLNIQLNIKENVKKVELVPEKIVLDYKKTTSGVEFKLPSLKGHQMIAIHYS